MKISEHIKNHGSELFDAFRSKCLTIYSRIGDLMMINDTTVHENKISKINCIYIKNRSVKKNFLSVLR